MIDSLQFLLTVYVFCIFLSIVTLFVTLFFVLPLQFQKAGVKNGLSSLRQKLLAKGLLSLFMSLIAVFVLSSRFFLEGEIVRYLNTFLILFFTVFWFVRELIESSIYHTQFTEDQIQLHHKIYKEEQRIEAVEKTHEAARLRHNTSRREARAKESNN